MEQETFDHLTRAVGRRTTRRSLAGLVGLAGIALPALVPDASGKKKKKCKPPKKRCGKRCLAVQTDPANCGACGRACAAGETCSGGVCAGSPQPQCPAGQKACNGGCIPAANCCTSAECGGGELCRSDVCIDGVCTLINKADSTPCLPGGGDPTECRNGLCVFCLARQAACSGAAQCCGSASNIVACGSNQHPGVACPEFALRCGGKLGASCSGNCDCLEGFDCRNGACCVQYLRDCAASADCCGNLTCQAGLCK